MPFPRRVRLVVEVPQRAALPWTVGDRERAVANLERHRGGRERLQLERVAAGIGGSIDDRVCALEAAEVVRRELGDDERRMIGADECAADRDRPRHWTTNSWKNIRRTLPLPTMSSIIFII